MFNSRCKCQFKSERKVYFPNPDLRNSLIHYLKNEKRYAEQVCSLINDINRYQKALTEKNRKILFFFLSLPITKVPLAIQQLNHFLQGKIDVQRLNQYLPDLYTSSLKERLINGLVFKKHPTLKDIRFETSEFNKIPQFISLKYCLQKFCCF